MEMTKVKYWKYMSSGYNSGVVASALASCPGGHGLILHWYGIEQNEIIDQTDSTEIRWRLGKVS